MWPPLPHCREAWRGGPAWWGWNPGSASWWWVVADRRCDKWRSPCPRPARWGWSEAAERWAEPQTPGHQQSAINQPINQSLTCETYTLGQWQPAIIHPAKQRHCSPVKCGKETCTEVINRTRAGYTKKVTSLQLTPKLSNSEWKIQLQKLPWMNNSAPKVTLPVKFPEQRCKPAISLKQQLMFDLCLSHTYRITHVDFCLYCWAYYSIMKTMKRNCLGKRTTIEMCGLHVSA